MPWMYLGKVVPVDANVESFISDLSQSKIEPQVYRFDGVSVGLRASQDGTAVYLMNIRSDPQSRGNGNASDALETLCDLADEHQVTLFLEVEASGKMDDDAVADWYWRYGFRGDLTEMIREPVARHS